MLKKDAKDNAMLYAKIAPLHENSHCIISMLAYPELAYYIVNTRISQGISQLKTSAAIRKYVKYTAF